MTVRAAPVVFAGRGAGFAARPVEDRRRDGRAFLNLYGLAFKGDGDQCALGGKNGLEHEKTSLLRCRFRAGTGCGCLSAGHPAACFLGRGIPEGEPPFPGGLPPSFAPASPSLPRFHCGRPAVAFRPAFRRRGDGLRQGPAGRRPSQGPAVRFPGRSRGPRFQCGGLFRLARLGSHARFRAACGTVPAVPVRPTAATAGSCRTGRCTGARDRPAGFRRAASGIRACL